MDGKKVVKRQKKTERAMRSSSTQNVMEQDGRGGTRTMKTNQADCTNTQRPASTALQTQETPKQQPADALHGDAGSSERVSNDLDSPMSPNQ